MNKQERGKLIKLYEEALRVNRDTSLTYPNPTFQFNQGYEWGINEAMKAAGFDPQELFDIWNRIKFVEPYEVEEDCPTCDSPQGQWDHSTDGCPECGAPKWDQCTCPTSEEAEALAQLREWTEDPHQDPPPWEPEPSIEDHEHFQVKHDDRRRVFVIIAKPHVLEWRVMPWEVHANIVQVDQSWKDKGYRYADIDEEV